jgi:hypothetical protein
LAQAYHGQEIEKGSCKGAFFIPSLYQRPPAATPALTGKCMRHTLHLPFCIGPITNIHNDPIAAVLRCRMINITGYLQLEQHRSNPHWLLICAVPDW